MNILSIQLPQPVTIDRAPAGVGVLTQYVKSQGYNPYGSITGSSGSSFVGIKTIE